MALRILARSSSSFTARLLPRPAALLPHASLMRVTDSIIGHRHMSTPPTDVPIPELGAESIVEGGILSLAKGVGDYVSAEEMVAEIETGVLNCIHRTFINRAAAAA